MTNNSHHVIPMDNGWKVRRSGSEKASKSFASQKDAIEYARLLSKNQQSELYIHKLDGTILTKESYGKDANGLTANL